MFTKLASGISNFVKPLINTLGKMLESFMNMPGQIASGLQTGWDALVDNFIKAPQQFLGDKFMGILSMFRSKSATTPPPPPAPTANANAAAPAADAATTTVSTSTAPKTGLPEKNKLTQTFDAATQAFDAAKDKVTNLLGGPTNAANNAPPKGPNGS